MYTSILLVPVAILALLVLGGIGAVVYLVVHALAGKKPGALLWVATGLLVLLVGMVLLGVAASVFVPVLHEVKDHAMNTAGNAPHVVRGFSLRLSWLAIALASAAVIAVIWALWRGGSTNNPREERSGWGKPLLLLGLVVLVLSSVVFYQRGEQVRSVQRRAEAVQDSISTEQPVTQLWQQMNKPRIQIIGDAPQHVTLTIPQPPTPEIPAPPSPLAAIPSELTPPVAAAASAPDASAEADRAMANLVTKIDALARHFATITERLAEMEKSSGAAAPAAQAEAVTADTRPTASAPTGEPHRRAEQPPSESSANDGVDAAVAADSEPAATVDNAIGNTAAVEPSAESRPAWVDDPPKRVGNTWREVIEAGEYATAEECYRAADIYLLLATYDRLMQLVGGPRMSSQTRPALTFQRDNVLADGQYLIVDGRPENYRLGQLARIGIGIDFVRREIAKDEYVDTVDRSVGPMKTLYTLVEFNSGVDRELRRRWDDYERTERFAVVGVIAAAVLGLLGAVYGLLKIDTWTKGYYTKRLFLGVPAVIMAIIGLIALYNDLI